MNIDRSLLSQIEKEACIDSFYEFVVSFWDVIIPENFIDSPHIKHICNELQILVPYIKNRLKKPYDLIFNVPPGSKNNKQLTQRAIINRERV